MKYRTAVAIVVVTVVWLALGKARDFHVYWQAGVALRTGGWTAVYAITDANPFKYHPIFAILCAPFGLLPERVAAIAWALINGAMVLDVQSRWQKRWAIDQAAIGMGYLCIGHAIFWQSDLANVTFAMLWLFTVALTTRSRWREALCYGVLIALKPFWIALIVPWLVYREFALIRRLVTTLVALSAVPLLLGVNGCITAYRRWIETFGDPMHARNYPSHANQSWYGLLYRHLDALGGRLDVYWLAGSAALGALWLWQWRGALRQPPEPDTRWQMEVAMIPLILWTAPLSWIHHQILLWPLLALVWQQARRSRSAGTVWLASLALLTLLSESVIGRAATLQVLGWGLPLIAFVVLCWWASQARLQRAT